MTVVNVVASTCASGWSAIHSWQGMRYLDRTLNPSHHDPESTTP
ncbi:hypothetical protein [Streptacidiphilus sp. PB12-B1b]|nr:hypothetical protein [Streptacidiphilus sp. PB12-B1b]